MISSKFFWNPVRFRMLIRFLTISRINEVTAELIIIIGNLQTSVLLFCGQNRLSHFMDEQTKRTKSARN
jgi:hypothetical protein